MVFLRSCTEHVPFIPPSIGFPLTINLLKACLARFIHMHACNHQPAVERWMQINSP